MDIKSIGVAGTLESSDIMITIKAGQQAGIKIELKSSVEDQFGNQIRKVIEETLVEMGIVNAFVSAVDQGALDCTIRARVMTAVYRANESEDFNWEVKSYEQ